MSQGLSIVVLLLLGLVIANLPWLSDKFLLVFSSQNGKSIAKRLLEWLVYYFLFLALGLGLERMANGQIHAQDWEFYAITFFLFLVFALPGFIYHYDFKKYLKRL